MAETADVVIVGAGIEGLSAAYQLSTRSDLDVLVLDRDVAGSGGTGKSSGVVRSHYGIPSLAAMAWFGTQFLERAPELLGTEVGFHQTGYVLIVGPGNVESLDTNVAMLSGLGIPTERISVDEAVELMPHVRFDDVAAVAWEPRSGYGDAARTAQAFSVTARQHGARLQQHRPVTGLRMDGDRVVGVDTTAGPIGAETVVVAAGPWSSALLRTAGIELALRAQREEIVIVEPGQPLFPAPVLSDLISLQYVRTEPTSELLVGNSDHSRPQFVDPDDYSNHAEPDTLLAAVERLAHRMPELVDPRVRTTYAGCYDITPDYNPVIDASRPGLVVCAGFSGHGFKISPAVGALVADLMLGTHVLPDSIDPSLFALDRWEQGRPLVSPAPYVGAGEMR